MNRFFDGLNEEGAATRSAADVAEAYGRFLLNQRNGFLEDRKKVAGSKYHVGLLGRLEDVADLTKRSILVTDTLLLSHEPAGRDRRILVEPARKLHSRYSPPSYLPGAEFFMQCPNFEYFGRCILNAEPLMRAGLAWHLPWFKRTELGHREETHFVPRFEDEHFGVFDYLIRDGRAVDMSGASPEKSELVRPILQIDLPFIDGVDLATFGKITVEEFAAYSAFRRFLRQEFMNIDQSLNSVQSQRELDKISLAIEDQVHAMKAEMTKIRQKRAVAVAGAGVGTVTSILAAVYGPAFKEVIQTLGASGGAWGLLTAMAENSPRRSFKENKWYYVWLLQREARRL